jgi:DNA-directed RNA polymerase
MYSDNYAKQLDLEHKYSKRLIKNKVKAYIFELELNLTEYEEVILTVVLSGLGKNIPIQSVVNSLIHSGMELTTATETIISFTSSGYYSLVNHGAGNIVLKPLVKLPNEMLRQFSITTVLPPLLVKPRKWNKQGKNGGYLSIKHDLVLGHENQHEYPVSVDVINKLQDISWELDLDIATHFKDETSYSWDKAIDITAQLMGNKFHFMWNYDSRGRMYSKGYEVNLQSSEYHKALLSFSNKEICTEDGIEELLCWVANTAGFDKLSWADRKVKGQQLIAKTVTFNGNDMSIDLTDIAEPILYTKAVNAYFDTVNGLSVGIPTMWDCTASGLQCLAVLTGCKETAKKVNLTNTGKREDVYEYLVELMNDQLAPKDYVTRELVKKPLMTHWYGSKGNPKNTFNDKQLKAFYKALAVGFTGPEAFMDVIGSVWEDKAEYVWTLPDGHTACVRTQVPETTRVTIAEDVFFDYQEMVNKPSGNKLHIWANVTHSVDAYVARELIRLCDFEVAHIHDSFVCHPNNAKALRKIFRQVLARLAQDNLLERIVSDLAGYPVKLEKLSNDLHLDILNSEYALS